MGLLSGLFGGGSSSSPNPYDVANAQRQSNTQGAIDQQNINAVNQQNPWGSLTYTRDPTSGQLTQTTSLNQPSQFSLDAQQNTGAYLSGQGLSMLGGVSDALNRPLSFGQTAGAVQPGQMQSNVANPQAQSSFAQPGAGQYQTSAGNTALQLNSTQAPTVNGFNFDASGMPSLNNDYGAQFNQVQQALLGRYTPTLDTMYGRQQTDLDTQLANQGITRGSDAYNEAVRNFSSNRDDAYSRLAQDSVLNAGQEQSRLVGYDQFGRQQLAGEQLQTGQINANIGMANAQNALAAAQQNQNAQQQQFQQQYANAQLNNQTMGQQFNQNLAAAQFGNQAAGQNFGQNLAAGQFGNAAQQQQFGQGVANAGLQNQGNAIDLQNQLTQQQYPLQTLQQLFGFGQSGAPQFGQTPTGQVQSPDISQYIYANANAQQQQQNGMLGGLFGLGGTALGAMFGGPIGAGIGGSIGNSLGGNLSGYGGY